MPAVPVVVFDVNETLSDMRPLADRFTDVGAPGHLAPLWFAGLLRDAFEAVLSVQDAGVWKPAPGSYAYAAQVCGVAPGDLVLTAVHPWDIDGAARAGLRTAYVDRTGAPYPAYCRRPDHTVTDLADLVTALRG